MAKRERRGEILKISGLPVSACDANCAEVFIRPVLRDGKCAHDMAFSAAARPDKRSAPGEGV